MSHWTDLYPASDLPPGARTAVHLPDGTEIALFNVGGTIHATDNMCIHAGGPLGEGYFENDTVTCPWHGWQFCVTNGDCLDLPGQKLNTYPVRVEDGRILAQL